MAEPEDHTSSAVPAAAADKSSTQVPTCAGHDSASNAPEETLDELRRRNAELTEANARLAEAVEARDTFLAVAAHELRNPMTPIVGRVQILRRMMRKPDFQPEKLEQGLEQVEWLIAQYVKRTTMLLDVSRVTTGKLQLDLTPADVCALAREAAESFRPIAEQTSSRIELDLPDEGLTVTGDRLAIEQILGNLVSNAIKYGEGRPIQVSAVADVARSIAFIRVRDGGAGISPADQARIFDRFERAVPAGDHVGGFGVGLWIVRQLSEAMGGSVEVTSTPGTGSVFCVALPLQPTEDPE